MPEAAVAYIESIRRLFEAGGAVMPVLFLCALLMGYALAWRGLVLLPGGGAAVEDLWAKGLRGGAISRTGLLAQAVRRVLDHRSELVDMTEEERAEWVRVGVGDLRNLAGRQRTVATSLVMSAPLLGLLGTVSGMIETFDALGEQAMFRQGGGIAGGISEALLTTEVGLCIAIPGTLIARMIDRREDGIRRGLLLLESLAQRDGGLA